MSGFDTTWLDSREPADRAARDAVLLDTAIDAASASPYRFCVDLGCGTGATLRAFAAAGAFPPWRLVDNDPALLEESRRRALDGLEIETVEADLSSLDQLAVSDAALVTASALFDLCSRTFVDGLAGKLAEAHVGLYAALNYDGTVEWEAPHPLDGEVVASFNAHQRGDKGFGLALGPDAGAALIESFERCGYRVRAARSPWRLDRTHSRLHGMFLTGMADAVAQTGAIGKAELAEWLSSRLAGDGGCRVGHTDVLALPPR